MYDDDWARGALEDLDLGTEPPSTVDVRLAVRRGRRRVRSRRAAVVAFGGGTTVLAFAAIPITAPEFNGMWQSLPSASSSLSEPAPAPPRPPSDCVRELLELPAATDSALVHAGDPTGRYAVGVAYRHDAGDGIIGPGSGSVVLWDNRKPVVLNPPLPGVLQGLDVNAAGMVLVSLITDVGTANWIYHDGVFTRLTTVGGKYTAMHINSRGDVAGAWLDDPGVHPPVIWPAGQPGKPRELVGGDPGDGAAASVGGIDDDGTVVGTIAPRGRFSNDEEPPSSFSRPVYWPAGGGPARDLPMPAGFGPNGWVLSVRGGFAVGHVERPDPDADRRGNRAAIWNLRTGTVVLDDRLAFAEDVNPHGWVVGRSSETPPARPVTVFAGNVLPLPMPTVPAPDSGGGISISDDGRTVFGSVRTGNDRMAPARWTCT